MSVEQTLKEYIADGSIRVMKTGHGTIARIIANDEGAALLEAVASAYETRIARGEIPPLEMTQLAKDAHIVQPKFLKRLLGKEADAVLETAQVIKGVRSEDVFLRKGTFAAGASR